MKQGFTKSRGLSWLAGGLLAMAVQGLWAAGDDVSPRIIGGTPAPEGAWPFAVQVSVGTSLGAAFCGGSLIAPRWVLTAGHCVDDNGGVPSAANVMVLAGTQALHGTDGTQVAVTNVYRHPDYSVSAGIPRNDLALLELAVPVDGPTATLMNASPAEGSMTTVVGWGITANGSSDLAQHLQQADVPVVSNLVCDAEYNGAIESDMLCAGYTNRAIDSCLGDSGGPLAVEINGVCTQVGIVSFGLAQCAETYGVYTRLSQFMDWIRLYVDLADAVPTPCRERQSGGGGGSIGPWWVLTVLAAVALLSFGRRRFGRAQ